MHQSLLGDEVWTYQDIAGRSLLSVLRNLHTGAENSPPLFFVLAWFSAKLGDPTIWIRLPSLILGTATLPLIYLLGRETVGRTAGWIGAAVVAASPFSTYYGIEARAYATMAFFVTLSTLALVIAVRTSSRPGGVVAVGIPRPAPRAADRRWRRCVAVRAVAAAPPRQGARGHRLARAAELSQRG
jgi:hypothetical protein